MSKSVPTQAGVFRPSVCDPIKENMQYLRLDEKICCGTEKDCLNVNTRCYRPDKLVRCHEISRIDACERRHRKNHEAENNDAVREICKKENINKRLCISTDSVNNPDLDGDLEWIVNRPFKGSNTELGASCQTCICCNFKECSRIFGKGIDCTSGCPINNITLLEQKCLDVFKGNETIGNIRVAICSDMFKLGNCQFYNISTGSLVKVEKNPILFFQPEVCDFTVGSPLLDIGDKIALGTGIGLGAPGFIASVLSVWIAWKQYKREKKRDSRGNNYSEIGLNNQQSQAQESQSLVMNVESSVTENRTEDTSNNSRSLLLANQRNEEIRLDEIQQTQI